MGSSIHEASNFWPDLLQILKDDKEGKVTIRVKMVKDHHYCGGGDVYMSPAIHLRPPPRPICLESDRYRRPKSPFMYSLENHHPNDNRRPLPSSPPSSPPSEDRVSNERKTE
ncbi:hypothetical protein QJS10_CPB22g00045 [Acorus calamus]|uniref:Uncharacterized protein n=1 Tax=Acorus calamus TaxID=4465 RepID=A0AAV9C298_ACOCL|nr:hypothetical protein QJS10_CPB22g00045 [Acorus calamus]